MLIYQGTDLTSLYATIEGEGLPVVILHGGGPDRLSIIPFAGLLKNSYRVIYPDIRGYGESICFDRTTHTWRQYAQDVVSLLDSLAIERAVICGMGLGASIAEQVAIRHPEKVLALLLISPENFDPEGEGSSDEEKHMLDRCAEEAVQSGLHAAWDPFKTTLAPVIYEMVSDAIQRTDPQSFSAAMAIVHDQRLSSRAQLAMITAPTLVLAGDDTRHDSGLGKQYKSLIPDCELGVNINWTALSTVEQLAGMVTSEIRRFLNQRSINKY